LPLPGVAQVVVPSARTTTQAVLPLQVQSAPLAHGYGVLKSQFSAGTHTGTMTCGAPLAPFVSASRSGRSAQYEPGSQVSSPLQQKGWHKPALASPTQPSAPCSASQPQSLEVRHGASIPPGPATAHAAFTVVGESGERTI
jgi:hypothetical protein